MVVGWWWSIQEYLWVSFLRVGSEFAANPNKASPARYAHVPRNTSRQIMGGRFGHVEVSTGCQRISRACLRGSLEVPHNQCAPFKVTAMQQSGWEAARLQTPQPRGRGWRKSRKAERMDVRSGFVSSGSCTVCSATAERKNSNAAHSGGEHVQRPAYKWHYQIRTSLSSAA